MIRKNKKDKVIDDIKAKFQKAKGKAYMYCFNKDFRIELMLKFINDIKAKRPYIKALIVVGNYEEFLYIKRYIDSDNDIKFRNDIKIITDTYVTVGYNYNAQLVFLVGVNSFDIIDNFIIDSMFILCMFIDTKIDDKLITKVNARIPQITTAGLDDYLEEVRINLPVEERRIGLLLDADSQEEYNKYTEFINHCIGIYGDIDTIDKCRQGDIKNNISATNYCYNVAKKCGWDESMINSDNEYYHNIDNVYNPNVIYEKAVAFYTKTKLRRDLLTDAKVKLDTILQICKDNADSKILVVSKRGSYAKIVAEYLNNNGIKCGEYHDEIEPAYILDESTNKPIVYKSGERKGEPKLFHSQAISSANEALFNAGNINVLSMKFSANASLETTCTLVIFTSPLCDTIVAFKSRYKHIIFDSKPTIIYKVYIRDTIENAALYKNKTINTISVIDNFTNINNDDIDINTDDDVCDI